MKLTVILANTWETVCLYNDFQIAPQPQKRSVTIELTPEQIEAIRPRMVGFGNGQDQYEIIVDAFIEET
jgi:hypothetical protein